MAYQQGGLITQGDFNNTLVGANPSTTRGQLNAVWGIGYGDAGYGQSFTQSASTGTNVTATQWGTLMTTVNNMSKHQSGTSSPNPALITPVVQGNTISYMSALQTALGTLYDNRLNYASQGSTSQSSGYTFNPNSGSTSAALDYYAVRTVTFSGGADAARYFFNAGGKLNFVTTSVTNNGGHGRAGDLTTLINCIGSINNYGAHSNGGRTGSGYSQTVNNTSIGYYNTGTTEQSIVYITSSNYPYSGDWAAVNVYSNGTQGSHGDAGSVIYFKMYVHMGELVSDFGNKDFNVSWNHRIDVVYPESNFLGASWGSVSVS